MKMVVTCYEHECDIFINAAHFMLIILITLWTDWRKSSVLLKKKNASWHVLLISWRLFGSQISRWLVWWRTRATGIWATCGKTTNRGLRWEEASIQVNRFVARSTQGRSCCDLIVETTKNHSDELSSPHGFRRKLSPVMFSPKSGFMWN